MREWRKIAEPMAVRRARKEGKEEALHAVRVMLLQAGDNSLTGFSAADLVRQIGLD